MSSSSSGGSSGSSLSQMLSALIPNSVVFAVFMLGFLGVRKKQPRVYEPRTSVETVPKELKTDSSPGGPWQWIVALVKKPHSWMVLKTGPDGYFFLRFIAIFFIIAVLGCCFTWPILFPLNIVNGRGEKELDMLAMGNVADNNRYIAHALISWVFFGVIIYTIYHEIVYYTTFRCALQTTPMYDLLISLRTLLLVDIPKNCMEEPLLRLYFPATSSVWYSRDYKELTEKIEERTKLANKYEGALNKVLDTAVNKRNKDLKKSRPVPEPEDDLNAYLDGGKKRPTHKLKPIVGKKVDTLDYGVEHLGKLNKEIKEEQAQYSLAPQTSSVFLEFPTQLDAQRAYQLVPYNKDIRRVERFIGLAPDDVIWPNLSLSRGARSLKKFVASLVLTLTIILWCIPVAVVGAISNINFLIEKLPWLSFLNNLPSQLMGVVTSLLPTIALSILMLLVPPFIKKMGKISGCVTVPQVEYYCQQWFYAFQVVNSFLTVTIASSAASMVSSIIDDPGSATSLVSENIPRASNFYIAYLILFGLSFSSATLLQLVPLILAQFLGKILDKTPRAKWNRYTTLGQPSYAVLYPNFQLLVLITIIYSIIAPLILGFAAVAFVLVFGSFVYTFVYVLRPDVVDKRGRSYPLALFLTFCALYFAEVILALIFGLDNAWPAMGIEIALILVTIAVHLFVKHRYVPLFDAVPVSALRVAAGDLTFKYPAKDLGWKEIQLEGQQYWEGGSKLEPSTNARVLADKYTALVDPVESDSEEVFVPAESGPDKAVVPPESGSEKVPAENGLLAQDKESVPTATNPVPTPQKETTSGRPTAPGLIQRLVNPRAQTFEFLRSQMPVEYFSYMEYKEDFVRTAYTDPAVRAEEPHVWIPKDPMGLAEIEKSRALENEVDVSDANAGFDEKGSVQFYGPPPSCEEAIKY